MIWQVWIFIILGVLVWVVASRRSEVLAWRMLASIWFIGLAWRTFWISAATVVSVSERTGSLGDLGLVAGVIAGLISASTIALIGAFAVFKFHKVRSSMIFLIGAWLGQTMPFFWIGFFRNWEV
jgi:hypothetical protein